jgi:hypothetical protein
MSVYPHTLRTTVWDVIEFLSDFMGNDAGGESQHVARWAIQESLREMANAFNWNYLYQHGRLQTNGQYTTGTIQVQVTSGPQPNYVTLTGGTFPTWTPYGTIRIGTVVYDVAQLIDSTHCTLVSNLAPVVDQAAGTAFTLFRDTYTLPADLVAMDEGFADVAWGSMEYVKPDVWLRVNRFYQSYSNTPRFYTVMGDPKVPNRLCLRIFPYPDQDRTIDFIYKRRPRAPALDKYEIGKATVDAINFPQTVTGSGTVWTASMVGSVIRLSSTTTPPTGWYGSNPAVMEFNIQAVVSGTSLTTDDVATISLSTPVAYRISDPIDIEDGVMLNAFKALCQQYVAVNRNMDSKKDYIALAKRQMILAREGDSRSLAERMAGTGGPYRQRLARMPSGPDVS